MANNQITINFQECEPSPLGYQVRYRPLGSLIDFRTWPTLFTGSPAVFVDTLDDENTSYEGTIRSICADGQQSIPMPFEAINPNAPVESDSGSESGSGPVECDANLQWDFTEDGAQGTLQIRVNGTLVLSTPTSGASGNIPVNGGDTILVTVNGQTGSRREIIISGCISVIEFSNLSGVSHEFEAECDCNYEISGNVSA